MSAQPRALTGDELAGVDRLLWPWQRETARLLRVRGALASSSRSEVRGVVEGELCQEPEILTQVEKRRRIARLQVPFAWGKRVRTASGDGKKHAPRIVVLKTILAHYELITLLNPWHAGRSRSLLRGLKKKHARCGERELACACRKCGKHHAVKSRCDDRFCFGCSAEFYGRLRSKLIHAAHSHQRALWSSERHLRLRVRECAECGRQHPVHAEGRSRPQLWTLTVEHGVDAAETRERITQGWVRLRAWLHKQLGRALPYALVWEWTRGSGEHGAHVHAHVLVLSPPLCWQALSAEWVRATDGRGRGVGHPSPRKRSAGPSVSSSAAARYIAKYASKGSAVHVGEDADEALLAEVWRSGYCKRRVTASRGFWIRSTRVTPCCLAGWVVIAARDVSHFGMLARAGMVPPPSAVPP